MGAMTFEDAMALIREDNAKFFATLEANRKKWEEERDERDRAREKEREEREKEREKEREEREKEREEREKEREEREKVMAKEREEREKVMAKEREEREKARQEREKLRVIERKEAERKERKRDRHWDQVFQSIGSLKRTMGELIELILMPKVSKQINKHGHKFNIVSANKHFFHENGKIMAEVDLMLENGDEVFVLEIKSNFRDSDIKEHLEQLRILRKNEKITGMKGRLIYAGIAGISMSSHIRNLAHSHGMYVLTIREEEERIEIAPPETKGKW